MGGRDPSEIQDRASAPTSQHLMLVPSLHCPASCHYCFGPHADGESMTRATVEALVRWQNALGERGPLDLTFHGGEPLVPGIEFYRMALPLLRDGFAPRQVHLGIQSNLWLLSDELCELFREYGVGIGTSLDGPEAINDAQRGPGYFQRSMAGIERARAHGLDVGCICTFTPQSARQAREVLGFFLREGLSFTIHAALPPLDTRNPRNPFSVRKRVSGLSDLWLSPQAHGELLVEMLELYLPNADRLRIGTLDSLCRSVSAGHGGICTFSACLGHYLAVGPQGDVFSCQRFAALPEYRLGNVHNCPSQEELSSSPVWRTFQDRQERVQQECGDCSYWRNCRGGCPYNALAASGGRFDGSLRDPHCAAYQRIFSHITERALTDVFSEENLGAVVAEGPGKHGLLRKGRLLQIMRGGPHPHRVARQARKVLAAAALAVSASPAEAVDKLERAGLVTKRQQAVGSLTALQEQLCRQPQSLVNAYLHVTYACNLSCDHCYASAGPQRADPAMAARDVLRLVREAAHAGFAKAVITGGEPLLHPEREALLDALAGLRRQVKPLQTVLRTNLATALTPELTEKLAHSTDQVVVSLDGDEATHDARRGPGAYGRTVANLRALLAARPSAQVALTAALNAAQTQGAPGQAVRALGEELGIAVRFKPVLPIGRAAGQGLAPEFYSSVDEADERVAYRAHVAATCGLGMNLYVGPGGECFPCYALLGEGNALGNALELGAAAILASPGFRRLKLVTVDSNRRCRHCALRYLCGGFCRAWAVSDDPDASPTDCSALYERAHGLLVGALESLQVSPERWCAADLPLRALAQEVPERLVFK